MLGSCPICYREPTLSWDREPAKFGWRYTAKVSCECGLSYETPTYYETFDKALDTAREKWNLIAEKDEFTSL